MTDLATRLGDRVNPIVVKEARQAVNSRLVGGALLLFLAVQLTVMTLMIGTREATYTAGDVDMRAGRDVFMFIQAVLLGTCMLLIPALTGGRLAAERSDVNVDLLFTTSLTPRAIMAGKLFTAAATALLIFSACAPFMTFAYVLRGLDFPTIALVLAADFLAVLYGTMAALLLAAIPANRGLRILLGIGGFLGLCGMFSTVVSLTAEYLRFGGGFDTTAGEFWLGFLGVAAGVAGAIGLMFVWATALITPVTANRALPVRAYTLGFWVAAAGGCAAWSLSVDHPGPVFVWGMCGTVVFIHQMLVAISERDEWGPRVRRRIPRRPLLRVAAWFLYSGAAGGIAFATTGGALSAAGLWAWHELAPNPHMHWPTRWWGPAVAAGLMVGYAYCYGLTAVLFRRVLRDTAFRPAYTGLAALILFGLGCIGPYLIRFVFYPRRYGYGYPDEIIGLYLPNPVVMIEDAASMSTSHTELTVAFLAMWGVMVTLLNVTWFAKQVRDFHPPLEAEVAWEIVDDPARTDDGMGNRETDP
jgi:hypothetical protein